MASVGGPAQLLDCHGDPMSALLLPAAALLLIFAGAVWHDVRSRRIPNLLILAGALTALGLHLGLPHGAGLFSDPPGGRGLAFCAAGFGAGLALLLPFYALGTMGAGDVKLMAVVGAFLGPAGAAGATLLTMLVGGVLAVVMTFWSGQLIDVYCNLQQMLRGAASLKVRPPARPTGKLAYAVAIAGGTALQLALADHPAWRVFS